MALTRRCKTKPSAWPPASALGPPDLQEAPAPPTFSAIYSGWYWRATLNEQVLRSRSLWDMDSLPTEARPVFDAMPLHRALGLMQEPLLARTVEVSVGEPPSLFA